MRGRGRGGGYGGYAPPPGAPPPAGDYGDGYAPPLGAPPGGYVEIQERFVCRTEGRTCATGTMKEATDTEVMTDMVTRDSEY